MQQILLKFEFNLVDFIKWIYYHGDGVDIVTVTMRTVRYLYRTNRFQHNAVLPLVELFLHGQGQEFFDLQCEMAAQ